MKIIGIDYGTKRIGVAVSDEGGTFAFPKEVIPGGSDAVDTVTMLAQEVGADTIVMGESRDLGGRENTLMPAIRSFAKALETRGFTVAFEQEYLSSVEAERFQGKTQHTDASAAAIILQRYLDKGR